MCHDSASRPPVFGSPATTVSSTVRLAVESSDGTQVGAFRAVPGEVLGASVLVLPDNRGLSGFYEDLCVRLAEQGHPALAIDYYGRTDGAGPWSRGADFPFMEHVFRVSRETLFADIRAGVEALRGEAAAGTGADTTAATLGFCFGGRQAFLTADAAFGVSAAIGFYGFPGELFGAAGPTQLAAGFSAPVLGVFGGADSGISAEVVAEFEAALEAGGVEHEIVTYSGMPHSFFDGAEGESDDEGARAAACADAWRRVLEFLH